MNNKHNSKFIPARPGHVAVKKYHTVLSHRFHWDEVVAYVLFLLFGYRMGIDISGAKIEFIKNNRLPDGKTVEQLDAEGYLVLGEGDGRFDEHGRRNADKICCAVLVARFLGIENHPALRGLLQEVCKFDRNASATKTCIANVMKEAYAARRRPVEKIIYWAIAAATDLVKWHMGKDSTIIVDESAYNGVFLKAWNDAAERQVWDDEMYARALKDYNSSLDKAYVGSMEEFHLSENEGKLLTELSRIYFVMVAVSGKDEADYWLEQAAFDSVRFQETWFKARSEFLKNAIVLKTQALVDGTTRDIRIGWIVSDAEVMNSVWRSTDAVKRFGRLDVLVQKRRTTDNVAIFLNHSSKLHSDDLARMLRWAEIDLSGRKLPEWEELAREETVEQAPEWYYHRSTEIGKSAIYNGSLSHPHVIPTRISVRGIQDIVCHAFHPDGVRIWRRDHDAFDAVQVQKHGRRSKESHRRPDGKKQVVWPQGHSGSEPSKEGSVLEKMISETPVAVSDGTATVTVTTAPTPEVKAETES